MMKWKTKKELEDIKHSTHWYDYDRNDPDREKPIHQHPGVSGLMMGTALVLTQNTPLP